MTVFASPRTIDGRGQDTLITVTAKLGKDGKGTGTVDLTATAGEFIEGSTVARLTLSNGVAQAHYVCEVAKDAGCVGKVTVTASWDGLTQGVDVTIGDGVLQPPPVNEDAIWRSGKLSTEKVYIFGTISEGSCGAEVISPLDDPTQQLPGHHCHVKNMVVRPGSGAVVYSQTFRGLFIYGADWWEYDRDSRRWDWPSDPYADDLQVPTPECADPTAVTTFLVHPEDGTIYYTCTGAQGSTWYSYPSGQTLVPGTDRTLISVGVGRNRLESDPWDSILVVVDSEGQEHPVELPYGASVQAHLVRPRADGFWVVLQHPVDYTYELNHVSLSGERTPVGTYVLGGRGYAGFMDQEGTIYAMGNFTDDTCWICDTISASRPDGSPPQLVYSEQNAFTNDWTPYSAPHLYTKLHGSFLFSGP